MEENSNQKSKGAIETISTWASNSSCNGVPHIVGDGSLARKLCWMVLVLAGTGLTLWQIVGSFQTYYSYPFSTAVSIETRLGIIFPAVTICNNNQIRKSALPDLASILQPVLPEHYGLTANYTQASASGRTRTRDNFDNIWAVVNDSLKAWAGHQKERMILDCEFDGASCSAQDFSLVLNRLYGNCFSFNVGSNDPSAHKAYKPGASHGLTLELFVDLEDYIPEMTDHGGLTLLVHDREVMPFPEDDGSLITPGYYSSITMREQTIKRLKAPYQSKCLDLEPDQSVQYNVYSEILPYVEYSHEGCTKTCYQSEVIVQCHCGDPQFPLNGTALKARLNKDNRHKDILPCSGITQEVCENTVKARARANGIQCNCSIPCKETIYIASQSMSEWPIPNAQSDYYQALAAAHPNVIQFNVSELRTNLARVSIYFDQLNLNVIQETRSMSPSSLFSSIGGIFGFYLGLSIVAMFEFAELILSLIWICISKVIVKKKSDD